jgi:O-antigen ligase
MAKAENHHNTFFSSLVRLSLGLEGLFIIFLFLLLTDAFLGLYAQQGYGIVIRLRFYIWKLNLFAVIILMLLRWPQVFPILKNAKFLLAFVGYVWLSHLWSPVPGETKFQAQRVIETTLFGIYIAARYPLKQQTRLLGVAFAIGAVFSLIYVFIFPGMAIMNDPIAGLFNAWRGVYIHKNTLGRMMVIGMMLFMTNAFTAPRSQRRIWWICCGISLLLIWGCVSKAALVSAIFLIGISPLHRIFRWNLAIAIPLYLIILLAGSLVAVFLGDNWAEAMGIIDKDPGLNGRVDIWTHTLYYIQHHPWLGWGYQGFWRMWEGPEHAKILRTIATWEPPDGHQGFLDLVLELGVIGAFLFSLGFFTAFIKAMRWIRAFPSVEGVWPLGFMTYYVIMNLTQTQLLPSYTIYWVVYTTIICTPIINRNESHPPEGYQPEQLNYDPFSEPLDRRRTALDRWYS